MIVVPGYLDDANTMVHIRDAVFFEDYFNFLTLPLSAKLNTDKIRAMASTSGQNLIDTLMNFSDSCLRSIGQILFTNKGRDLKTSL